jgi:DnaJ-class molecular chaperone
MKIDKSKEPIAETKCPACEGAGVVKPKQQALPGRRIYSARCPKCDGKGKVTLTRS